MRNPAQKAVADVLQQHPVRRSWRLIEGRSCGPGGRWRLTFSRTKQPAAIAVRTLRQPAQSVQYRRAHATPRWPYIVGENDIRNVTKQIPKRITSSVHQRSIHDSRSTEELINIPLVTFNPN
jgi:hypothetical protein